MNDTIRNYSELLISKAVNQVKLIFFLGIKIQYDIISDIFLLNTEYNNPH